MKTKMGVRLHSVLWRAGLVDLIRYQGRWCGDQAVKVYQKFRKIADEIVLPGRSTPRKSSERCRV